MLGLLLLPEFAHAPLNLVDTAFLAKVNTFVIEGKHLEGGILAEDKLEVDKHQQQHQAAMDSQSKDTVKGLIQGDTVLVEGMLLANHRLATIDSTFSWGLGTLALARQLLHTFGLY